MARLSVRQNVRDFVATIAAGLALPEPIVEIGALQVEGQEGFADLRPLIPSTDYIGCDMRPGLGVDRIEDIEAGLTFPDASIGTVLCVDTLEHVFDVAAAFREFRRVLKPGGVLAITSVMLFPIHSHPYDYWRFTPDCFSRLLHAFDRRHVWSEGEPDLPHTVYGLAALEPAPSGFETMLQRITEMVRLSPQDGRGLGWQPSMPWPGRGGPASSADIAALQDECRALREQLKELTDALSLTTPQLGGALRAGALDQPNGGAADRALQAGSLHESPPGDEIHTARAIPGATSGAFVGRRPPLRYQLADDLVESALRVPVLRSLLQSPKAGRVALSASKKILRRGAEKREHQVVK